jgi:chorismate mutase
MFTKEEQNRRRYRMADQYEYYVLKKKAVPEVLLKVVEAKELLDSRKITSVQQAADAVGISRSSFYKYKEDIFPFRDTAKGKAITLLAQVDDRQGLLSELLGIVAFYKANILMINQSIPVSAVASITLSLEISEETGDVDRMIKELALTEGVHSVKILARE